MVDELALDTLSGAAEAARRGLVSPTELVARTADRVALLGSRVNCHITVTLEAASLRAKALEALSPAARAAHRLYGTTVSIKDCLATAGVTTTVGSPIYQTYRPSYTARAVERITEAGGIVYAKDNMYDFQYCGPNPAFGDAVNPWSEGHTTGGSSSGSASAVSAGISHAALGTDGGGSIRIPSAYCGVVGMKPTFDAVSGEGELPCHGSLSCVGPICRNVRDAALVFEVIREVTGPPLEIDSGIRGTRVGVPSDIGVCDPEVRALFEAACEVIADQGAIVRRIEPPEFPAGRSAMWIITGVEYAEALRPVLRGRPDDLHPLTRALLERAEFIPATEYVHAQRVRSALARAMATTMAELDVLVVPTVPSPAYIRPTDFEDPGEIGDHPVNMSTYFTALFNTTGQPAVTVPCGVTADGLPVGLQIAGRPYDEALILRVAQNYECASGGIGSPPLSIAAVDTRQG